jgi:shikimate kinase
LTKTHKSPHALARAASVSAETQISTDSVEISTDIRRPQNRDQTPRSRDQELLAKREARHDSATTSWLQTAAKSQRLESKSLSKINGAGN